MWKCTKCQAQNQDTVTACVNCNAIRPTTRFSNPSIRPGAQSGTTYDAQNPSMYAHPGNGQDANYGRPAQADGMQPNARRTRAQAAAMPGRAGDEGYGDAPAQHAPAEGYRAPQDYRAPERRRPPEEYQAPSGYAGAQQQQRGASPARTGAPQARVQRNPPPQGGRFPSSPEPITREENKGGWVRAWLSVCGYTLLVALLITPVLAFALNIQTIAAFFTELAAAANLPGFVGYIAMGLAGLLTLVICTLPGTLVLAVSRNMKK